MKFFLIFVSFFVAFAKAQDWCNFAGCQAGTHIKCVNPLGSWSKSCAKQKLITFGSSQVQRLLDAHNEKRNLVASGKISPFPTAVKMSKLVWNAELASLAELNVKQCAMKHDKCRTTATLKYPGQNLAVQMTTGTYTPEQVIDKAIKGWFDENKDATVENIDEYGTFEKGTIGHFTAMVTDRSNSIGCAMSNYFANGWNTYLLCCNFASTNMQTCPVYRSGPVGKECTLGRDTTFTSLCKSNEPSDPNKLIGCNF